MTTFGYDAKMPRSITPLFYVRAWFRDQFVLCRCVHHHNRHNRHGSTYCTMCTCHRWSRKLFRPWRIA